MPRKIKDALSKSAIFLSNLTAHIEVQITKLKSAKLHWVSLSLLLTKILKIVAIVFWI